MYYAFRGLFSPASPRFEGPVKGFTKTSILTGRNCGEKCQNIYETLSTNAYISKTAAYLHDSRIWWGNNCVPLNKEESKEIFGQIESEIICHYPSFYPWAGAEDVIDWRMLIQATVIESLWEGYQTVWTASVRKFIVAFKEWSSWYRKTSILLRRKQAACQSISLKPINRK